MPIDVVDYRIKDAAYFKDEGRGLLARLRTPSWEKFFDTSVQSILGQGGTIMDIGGGLRIDPKRRDRFDPRNYERYKILLAQPNVSFKTTDYTDQYGPDFVEDIHHLSFRDGSVDGLFCMAVLEHVYDPKKAAGEIVRVLRKGGLGLIYVPFLYRYHAHQKDYKDYFRYSRDGIAYLFRECESVTICPVRGLFETLLRFTPLHMLLPFRLFARFLDQATARMRKVSEKQTSGYHVLIRK